MNEKQLEEVIKRVPQLSYEELTRLFSFHPAKNEQVAKHHSRIRYSCKELAEIINEIVPEGREKTLAITKLEEVMMWANAGIARNG
jgi:hypothetical protein